MLGNSSGLYNEHIKRIVSLVSPASVLEIGCGEGKFASLAREVKPDVNIEAVQKIFGSDDEAKLKSVGYSKLIDADILEYFKKGFDEDYNLVVALDVIEHFMLSDVLSIINFALYRADYMLLVWPSKHPQKAVTSGFDVHRSSFELSDISGMFDVVHYHQTGFANVPFIHRYHLALLRGFMNVKTFPAFI